jgi:hypothetical protein
MLLDFAALSFWRRAPSSALRTAPGTAALRRSVPVPGHSNTQMFNNAVKWLTLPLEDWHAPV